MARRKRRRSAAGTSRRRRRHVARANPKRRRRHALFTRAARRRVGLNPRRRRRHAVNRAHRRYRRNPGIATGGIMRMVVQGAKDGFAVTLGRGVTKLVAQKIPFGQTSTVGQGAMQLVVGTALALVVKKALKSERAASMFLAGAYSNVIQTALVGVPVIGPALSGVSSWPRVVTGVSSWPRALPAPVTVPSNALGQPWGYEDANVADGIQS